MYDASHHPRNRRVTFRPVILVLGIAVGTACCAIGYGQSGVAPGTRTPRLTRTPVPTRTPWPVESLQALRNRLQTAKNSIEKRYALAAIHRKGAAAAPLIPDLLEKLNEGWDSKDILGTFEYLGPEGRATLARLIREKGTTEIRVRALWDFLAARGGPWSPDELRTVLDASLDPDEKVSATALKALSQDRKLNKDSIPAILSWYRQSPGPDREKSLTSGLKGVLSIADEGATALIKLQSDPDPTIRQSAREAFPVSRSPGPAIKSTEVPGLFEALERGDEEFYYMARRFGIPRAKNGGSYFKSMLESKNERQRALAVRVEFQRLKTRAAIDLLRKGLKDGALLVRTEAAIGVSAQDLEADVTAEDRTESLKPLEEALSQFNDDSFREDIQWALKRLQNFGATPTPILEALRSADREVRSRAAQELWRRDIDQKTRKEAVPLLLAMITKDELATHDALVALTSVGEGDPSVVPVARNVLDGKVVQFHSEGLESLGTGFIKVAAWEALARNGTAEAGNAVCEMLQEPTMKWNMLLFRAIADLGPNARCALPELKRLFDDLSAPPTPTNGNRFSSETLRLYRRLYIAGCFGVFNEDGERAIPLLVEGLHAPKPWMRAAAAENIAHWGPKASDAITTLVVMLGAPSETWISATWLYHPANPVAKALASMGKMAVPQLLAALDNKKPAIRLGAAQALGMMGSEASAAIPVLVQSARTDKKEARIFIRTVAEIGPPPKEAVPLFVEFMKKGSQSARIEAINSLERMGPSAAGAIPDLEALAANQDENHRIRKAARSALLKIRTAPEQGSKSE